MKKDFSVVIPTLWNSERLEKTLDLLEKSEAVEEVIVIDNDPAQSRDLLRFSKVKK